MRYILFGIAILYGLLSTVAAYAQLKAVHVKDAPTMMLCGGLLLLLASLMSLYGLTLDWIFAAIGGIFISIAAFLNGRRGDNFHLHHHVIRLVITVVLVIGFIAL